MKTITVLLGTILLSLSFNQNLAAQTLQKAIQSKKLDAGTQALLRSLDRDLRYKSSNKIDAAAFESLSKNYSLEVSEQNELLLSLFVQTDGNNSELYSIPNAEIRGVYGGVVSLQVPVTQISELAALHSIRRIEASRKVKLLNDKANIDTKVNLVHAGSELPKAFKGDSVIIGVVDTGIDFTHLDFSNEEGNSRILFIRESDQIWDTDDIMSEPDAITQKDLDGHGTHVTGTAAGYSATSGYSGVAPSAFIIASKTNLTFDDILNGVEFIFNKADSLDMPAVVNLSLGSNSGPHDGSTLAEAALSSLVGPGKIIVASAGNAGSTAMHLNYAASDDTTFTKMDAITGYSVIDSYFSQQDDVKFGLMIDDGTKEYYTPAFGKVDEFGTEYIIVNSDTLASFYYDFVSYNNDTNAYFEASYDIAHDIYIYTIGEGEFHAWAYPDDYFDSYSNSTESVIGGDSEFTVGTPATAENLIAVGAYMTRRTWTDRNGDGWQVPNSTEGEISYFSSIGPSRDGRILPHISAPGQMIISALSAEVPINEDSESYILEGDEYQVLQGTSMSAPHVSGIIALMLQAYPDLTHSQALEIFKSTARTDSFTGNDLPNNTAGSGKVDALAAVKAAVALNPTANEPDQNPFSFKLLGNYPNPFNPTTIIRFELGHASTVNLTVFDMLGRKVNQLVTDERMSAGTHEITFEAQNLSSGIYFIRLQNGEHLLTHKMMLLK